MQKIDRLLSRALALSNIAGIFYPTDSAFVLALGVDPGAFSVINPDGSTGYNEIKALHTKAAEDWTPEDLFISVSVDTDIQEEKHNTAKKDREEAPEFLTMEQVKNAQEALTQKEVESLLALFPVLIGNEKRHITLEEIGRNHESGQPQKCYTGKSRNLFGWG